MTRLTELHAANIARQAEWCPDQGPDLSFRGNELGGECGEAQNVIKKLERERLGWRGSRATMKQLAEELADVVICADLCAMTAGIDLAAAVVAKFNATSEKVGLTTKLAEAGEVEQLKAALAELHAENRRMRDALFELGPACKGGNADDLRQAAGEIDCGQDCRHHFYDGSCNAHECSREDTDEGCSWLRAEALRSLADSLEVRAELAASAPSLERVRHLKRGLICEVLGEAEVQLAKPQAPRSYWSDGSGRFTEAYSRLHEGDKLTVYQHDGKLWARFTDEFRDGRFETIVPASPAPGGDHA